MGTSLRELEADLIPTAQGFLRLLEKIGMRYTINSVRRDVAQQQKMYDAYLAGDPRYSHGVAPPGRSPHNLGIAFDANLYWKPGAPPQLVHLDAGFHPKGHGDASAYLVAGYLWERLGLRWGGRFNPRDEIHFDFWPTGYVPPSGQSITALWTRRRNGGAL